MFDGVGVSSKSSTLVVRASVLTSNVSEVGSRVSRIDVTRFNNTVHRAVSIVS